MSKRTSNSRKKREPIKELPAFVYGTLRSGFGNYRALLEGNTDKEELAVLKASIHLLRNGGGIPGIKHGTGSVVGELMHIPSTLYQYVMENLDDLEGNGFFYNREEVTVTTLDGEKVQAWAYYYCNPERMGKAISHGDFKKYVIESRR